MTSLLFKKYQGRRFNGLGRDAKTLFQGKKKKGLRMSFWSDDPTRWLAK